MIKNPFLKNSDVFIIAEAGSNWKCGSYADDLEQARKLIKIAANAGANAVKFQTFKSETIYVPNAGQSDYLHKQGIDSNINDIFKDFSMPYEMIPELAKFCEQEKIFFMSTPFSVQDAMEIDPFVKIHKIASFEINHVRLIEFLSSTSKPILISTGASSYAEIDFAINLAKNNGNSNLILLQCTSKYPCPINSLNLSVIPHLKEHYDLPVGLSDHSIDPILAPVLAVSYGATVIEKHFTLDKKLSGPDHSFSLNPEELRMMIKYIRDAELARGTGIKEILKDELELKQFATRALQATHDISRGDILKEGENFDVLRPGKRTRGIDARFLETINGKKAKNDIKQGEGITSYE